VQKFETFTHKFTKGSKDGVQKFETFFVLLVNPGIGNLRSDGFGCELASGSGLVCRQTSLRNLAMTLS